MLQSMLQARLSNNLLISQPRLMARMTAWLLSLLVIMSSLLSPATTVPVQAATTEEPVPVVTGGVSNWSVGAGLLYWADCSQDDVSLYAILKRKPTGGGTERTLEEVDGGSCGTYQNLVATADGLYYFDSSQGRIERIPLSEPYTPQEVKVLNSNQSPTGSRGLVEAGDYLYWVNSSGKVYRVRKDGSGNIETVADTASGTSDVMVVGNTVYWIDSEGVHYVTTNCDTLPCGAGALLSVFEGDNTSGYGLLYQPLGFQFGRNNYRVYWVQQVLSGSNRDYTIRYRACNDLTICFILPPEGSGIAPDPPETFQASATNWRIGNPLLVNGNLYWTEADFTTVSNSNGDVKRKAYNSAAAPDTIATGQAAIDSRLYADNTTLFFARRNNGVYSLPLNATAILRDLSVDGMEVTQGIQNLANNAPLVADKTTYVRVYGKQLSGPSAPNVEIRLVGTQGNTSLGPPLQPINGVRGLTTGGGYDRAKLNDGWYFLLPSYWLNAGQITLKVEVDPRLIHNDPNRDNNELSLNVTLQNQPPVCVWTVPVRTHTAKPAISDPNFWAMVSQFDRRWPVPTTWIFQDTNPVEELEVCWYGPIPHPCYGPYELSDEWGIGNGGLADRDKVIVSLWGRAQLSFNPDACDDIGAPVHFMGLVHPDADNGGASGYASTVSSQSWVQLPDHLPNPMPTVWNSMRAGSTMAQELAHNTGRKHVDCNSPDNIDNSYPYPPCQIANTGADSYYGFDPTSLSPIRPDQTADFMSYASRSWVSDYTWRALLNEFATAQAASTAATAEPVASDAGDSVFVTGMVDTANNRGEIDLVLVLPTDSVPPATRQMQSVQVAGVDQVAALNAVYKLRLLDPQGNLLVERTLTLLPMDDHTEENNAALFSDLFAKPAATVATVQLVADNTVIDTVAPGINPPTVSIQQPTSGTTIADSMTIAWTASDPDPADSLLFTVQYSYDNGASWHTLALNLPGTPDPSNSLILSDLGSLHGSGPNTARIRVLATDGFNTAIATSAPFTVNNRPPLPAIFAPDNGQTLPAGPAVLLQGSATDAEDGGLTGDALQWQVDGNAIVSGTAGTAAGLAPGAHTATLAATDANNQTANAEVNFNIAPLSVPLGTAPLLDGICDDASYAAGSSLQLKPYGDGTQAIVQILRSDDYLWACFSGLKPGADSPGAYAGLRADINDSRNPTAQPSDTGFFAGEDGDVFTLAGNGAGDFVAPGPGGLAGQVSQGSTSWNAELRIDKAALGGWDHLVGLSFGHHDVAEADDDYAWPYLATWGQPNTWATTALGIQPVITTIDPLAATVQGPAFTMTVTGSSLVNGTVVLWNGTALPTTFVDSERLMVQVAAAQLNAAGIVQVTTRGPAPGNFESNALPFVVQAAMPVIASLSPTSTVAGNPTMTLTINGSNFAADAKVLWNGAALTTQFVNPTQIKVEIAAALLENGQVIGVAVSNQLPDPRISPAVPFEVRPSDAVGEPLEHRNYLPVVEK